ncbi:MAG: hypothetical protein AAF351_08605 [Pseudomonadota bacterium]
MPAAEKFLDRFFKSGPFYLRINRDRVAIRNVATGNDVEFAAKVGIDANQKVVSYGDPVDPSAITVAHAFQHPRMLIPDYEVAEKVVHHAVRELAANRYFQASPVLIMHVDIELDGGLTPLEARALREMAERVGARETYIHIGPRLSDDDVANLRFQSFDQQSQN